MEFLKNLLKCKSLLPKKCVTEPFEIMQKRVDCKESQQWKRS